jgi:hypothetical protein
MRHTLGQGAGLPLPLYAGLEILARLWGRRRRGPFPIHG